MGFQSPAENRTLVDTSAAAIAASGLLRLCRLINDPMKGHFYWSTAIQILHTLCTQYVPFKENKWEGVLKGGVYHVHKGLGVDESVMWGEYFFVEAFGSGCACDVARRTDPDPAVAPRQDTYSSRRASAGANLAARYAGTSVAIALAGVRTMDRIACRGSVMSGRISRLTVRKAAHRSR